MTSGTRSESRTGGHKSRGRSGDRKAKEARSGSPNDESPPRRSFGAQVAGSLPYAVAGILLIVYFVWLISEMSTAAVGGVAVPAAIFGGVLLGILGGGAGVFLTRNRA